MPLMFYDGAPSRAQFWRDDAAFWRRSLRGWQHMRTQLACVWAVPVWVACFAEGPTAWVFGVVSMTLAALLQYGIGDAVRDGIARCARNARESEDVVLWLEAGIIPPAWVADIEKHQTVWQ